MPTCPLVQLTVPRETKRLRSNAQAWHLPSPSCCSTCRNKKTEIKNVSILFALHLSVWRCVLWIKRKRKLNSSQRKKRRPFLFSSKTSLCEHCIYVCGWSNVRPSFPRLLFSLSGAPSPYRQHKCLFYTFKLMACFKRARQWD